MKLKPKDTQSQTANQAFKYSQSIIPLYFASAFLYTIFSLSFCLGSILNRFWFSAAWFESIFAQINS